MSERLDIGCHNCMSACCRGGTQMSLTAAEAAFLRSGGTEIEDVIPPESVPHILKALTDRIKERGLRSDEVGIGHALLALTDEVYGGQVQGIFRLQTDCGYLATDSNGKSACSIYMDEQRPFVCKNFEPDSVNCNSLRRKYGLTSRSDINAS